MSRLHTVHRQITKLPDILRIYGSASNGNKTVRSGQFLWPHLGKMYWRPGVDKHKQRMQFSGRVSASAGTQKAPQNNRSTERGAGRIHVLQAAMGLVGGAELPKDAILVSLDTEKDANGTITQIGLAVLDPRQLSFPSGASSHLGSAHVHFFEIDGGKVRSPHPTLTPTKISKGAIAASIRNRLSLQSPGGHGSTTPDIVLIGHSISSDLWSLRKNGVDLAAVLPVRAVICTYDISKSLLADPASSLVKGNLTLAGALAQFDVTTPREELHNAASDALYALQLALLLGIKSMRTDNGITKLRHVVQNHHLASLKAVTDAIIAHGPPEADGKVGFHLMRVDTNLPSFARRECTLKDSCF